MTGKPDKQRAAEYAAKMRKEGYKRICLWVPEDQADRLRAYAKKLKPKG